MDQRGQVALIGLGEVGRVMAEDLCRTAEFEVVSWDVGFADADSHASRNADELGITSAASSTAAVSDAQLIVSAVTAAHSVAAAREASSAIAPGAWFLDLNSSSPAHKSESARLIDAAGGRYVEAGLMSPIEPRRMASSFLLGGQYAEEFAAEAADWGFTSTRAVSSDVGRAAATKLCRSVVVKGLEALFTESFLAARSYGVEADVLASLSNILPTADWEQLAAYFVGRSVQHGVRRAEEMEEAAATVRDAGVEPWMANATVQRQRWAAGRVELPDSTQLFELIDGLLATTDEVTR
jgi:3-hydroxyisobutyrate dehydrogenase-like beta-hydroxyacid dehydrogenase